MKTVIQRKGTEVRFFKFGDYTFFDLFKLTTQGSLMKLGQLLTIDKMTRTGLRKDLTIPYSYFDCMEKLEGNNVPDYDDQSWLSLKDGTKMLSREEHAEVTKDVEAHGWWNIFSIYLRKVRFFSNSSVSLTLTCAFFYV